MHWSHGLQHLRHKRPTFAFTSESGHTLGSRRKIAHSGSHGETGAFSPSATAGLCVASEIAPITTFATLDSAMLLYTYISRFSVNPHCQQREKIRQSCRHKLYPELFHIAFFNFSHKWPTFAFTSESGYTLGFTQRIAHKGTHGETGVFRMRVVSLPSDCFTRFGNPAWPGFRTANFGDFGSRSETLPKNAECLRDSDALMRVAVPRRRSPAGLRNLFSFLSKLRLVHTVPDIFFDSPDAPACAVPVKAVSLLLLFGSKLFKGFRFCHCD